MDAGFVDEEDFVDEADEEDTAEVVEGIIRTTKKQPKSTVQYTVLQKGVARRDGWEKSVMLDRRYPS